MANTFPLMSSGSMVVHGSTLVESLAKYPVTTSGAYVVRIIRFLGDQEQAWVVRAKLFSCSISYSCLNGYDVARIMEFFQTMRGMYVDSALLNTFDITLNGVNYLYCVFDQDEVPVMESAEKPNYFNLEIRIRQLRPN